MAPWLICDGNYLAYRAFHSRLGLSHNGKPTSVIFGLLSDVAFMMEQFKTNKVAFAWDFGRGKRREVYPAYKLRRETDRNEETEEEQQERRDFQAQVAGLRNKILRKLGFRNVYFEEGFEADDIIASITKWYEGNENLIIVSADEDLWQLIRERVSCWNPKKRKMTTLETFREEWGIEPPMWAYVKAAAGCSTDEVEGIRGVGEATAAKFYANKLKQGTKAYEKLMCTEGLNVINRNMRIVSLPFEGTPEFTLKQCTGPKLEAWNSLCDFYGMRSLRTAFPGQPRGVKQRKGLLDE